MSGSGDGPKVSVLMTVHNREAFVAEAIASVRRQSLPDWELIVWDDGSTDGSLSRARDAAGGDSRIRIFEGEHQGVCPAAQSAAQQARGAYLGWLDSDDRLAPAALKETARQLDHRPDVGLVYTQYNVINEQGRNHGLGSRCKIPYSPQRLLVDFMLFHFRLMRRSVFEQIGGFDTSFELAPDYDLCLRATEVTQVHHVPRPLYDYRVHARSISLGRRYEQIQASQRAVEAAIRRRGLADELELEVELVPQFKLRKKTAPSDG